MNKSKEERLHKGIADLTISLKACHENIFLLKDTLQQSLIRQTALENILKEKGIYNEQDWDNESKNVLERLGVQPKQESVN